MSSEERTQTQHIHRAATRFSVGAKFTARELINKDEQVRRTTLPVSVTMTLNRMNCVTKQHAGSSRLDPNEYSLTCVQDKVGHPDDAEPICKETDEHEECPYLRSHRPLYDPNKPVCGILLDGPITAEED